MLHSCFRVGLATLLIASPLLAQQPPARGGGFRGGTQIQPGEACPAGTTEIRPRTCQAPELPAPSILDYRPRSTLVAPAHTVPRAKFPVIDFHGHPSAHARLGRERSSGSARRSTA